MTPAQEYITGVFDRAREREPENPAWIKMCIRDRFSCVGRRCPHGRSMTDVAVYKKYSVKKYSVKKYSQKIYNSLIVNFRENVYNSQ